MPAADVLEEADLGFILAACRVAVKLGHNGFLPVLGSVALKKVRRHQLSQHLPTRERRSSNNTLSVSVSASLSLSL